MLILTRKIGESVVIDNDIIVTIEGRNGNQVKLSVKAPRDVIVHRQEIFDRIDKQVDLREKEAA